MRSSIGLAAALIWCGACSPPDLGTAPFLCNNGTPQCPGGYHCETAGGVARCVKNGVTLDAGTATDPTLRPKDGGQPDPDAAVAADTAAPPIDTSSPEDSAVADTAAPDTAIPDAAADTFVPLDMQMPDQFAPDMKPPMDGPPPQDTGVGPTKCAHSPCKTGGPLDANCFPAVADVCDVDLICCWPLFGLWDQTCVNAYKGPC